MEISKSYNQSVSHFPDFPNFPNFPDFPDFHNFPDFPNIPNFPDFPDFFEGVDDLPLSIFNFVCMKNNLFNFRLIILRESNFLSESSKPLKMSQATHR